MARIISMVSIAVLTAIDQFIEGFIGWHYVRNTGAAFSSFSNNTTMLSVFTAVVILIGIVVILTGKLKDKVHQICAVMIVSGGLGNLIDRVLRGYVTDYIEVQFVNFAVFNFADILITCGAFMLMGYTIYEAVAEQRQKKAGDKNG